MASHTTRFSPIIPTVNNDLISHDDDDDDDDDDDNDDDDEDDDDDDEDDDDDDDDDGDDDDPNRDTNQGVKSRNSNNLDQTKVPDEED